MYCYAHTLRQDCRTTHSICKSLHSFVSPSNQFVNWLLMGIRFEILIVTRCIQDGENAYGANRWDEAMFSNDADKQKFIKLMGVKANAGQEPSQQSLVDDERENLSADQHAKVLTDVETHFMQGLRRADGRKVGLGL